MAEHRRARRNRRRGKMRRPFKRMNAFLKVFGVPSACIGLGMCAVAAAMGNTALLVIGACYGGIGVLCLIVFGVLSVIGDSIRRSRGVRRSDGQRAGMALVVVLVMMAILSTLVVHALSFADISLRAARADAARAELRRHTASAVWHLVADSARSGEEMTSGSVRSPDGYTVELAVSDAKAPAGVTEVGSKERVQSVTAAAATNGISAEVYCLTVQDSVGTVRIARWLER